MAIQRDNLMATYYEILGISPSAGNNEIKAAFRHLAKLYHPDKNPNGKEHFEKILVAYEVLINHNRRKQYDLKLKYAGGTHQTTAQTKAAKKKEWGFSDEELKRRQYFKENYKKEYRQYQEQYGSQNAKVYNEYKYILFAAPLAVGLFLFVVNGFENDNESTSAQLGKVKTEQLEKNELNLGDDPYTNYFKDPVFDNEANKSMTIKNLSGNDAVVCFFGKEERFVRCCFLKDNYSAELSQLPNEDITLKMVLGKDWNDRKTFENSDAVGGFENPFGFFSAKQELKDMAFPITLDQATLKSLEVITEKDFFKKQN